MTTGKHMHNLCSEKTDEMKIAMGQEAEGSMV
jgi:hypothetical protein